MDATPLFDARFGLAPKHAAGPVDDRLAALLSRRVCRRYKPDPVPEATLELLLAAAQSAPAKSDLQQYAIVVVEDPGSRAKIAGWIRSMPDTVSREVNAPVTEKPASAAISGSMSAIAAANAGSFASTMSCRAASTFSSRAAGSAGALPANSVAALGVTTSSEASASKASVLGK